MVPSITELRARAERHDHLGELDQAIQTWRAVIQRDPRDFDACTRLVYSYLRAGRSREGLGVAQALVSAAPHAAAAHCMLGLAREATGDRNAAASSFRQAAILAPDSQMIASVASRAAHRLVRTSAPRQREQLALLERYSTAHGWQVQGGPFAGMKLIDVPNPGFGAALHGSYEFELQDLITAIIAQQPSLLVNIGSAEGYYAVGMAHRLPQLQAHAFEMDPECRQRLEQMIWENDMTDRITAWGECTLDNLRQVLAPGAVVFSDCEGAELYLLRPSKLPVLRTCSLLVELHEFVFDGITRILQHRFGPTHELEFIDADDNRDFSSFELPAGFERRELVTMLAELRPAGMRWAWMTPRT